MEHQKPVQKKGQNENRSREQAKQVIETL